MDTKYLFRILSIKNVVTTFVYATLLFAGASVGMKLLGTAPHSSQEIASQRALASATKAQIDTGGVSIILALDPVCPYCDKSMTFYRPLLEAARTHGFSTNAIFSAPIELSAKYVRDNGLRLDGVSKVDISSYSVHGTPTLIVVDSQGRDVKRWVGMMNTQQRLDLLELLGLGKSFVSENKIAVSAKLPTKDSNSHAASDRTLTEIGTGRSLLVDTRSRASFVINHAQGAVNIPLDELSVLARAEIPTSANIILYCDYDRECDEALKTANSLTYCTIARSILVDLGYHNVSIASKEQYASLPAAPTSDQQTFATLPWTWAQARM